MSTWLSPMAVRIVSPVPCLAMDVDRGLLFEHPVQRLAQLVEVGLALGLDRDLQARSGEPEARQLDGMLAIGGERIAGSGGGQLCHRRDISWADLRHVLLLLALHPEQVADPLLLPAARVVDMPLRVERPGDDAEVGQPADEGIRGRLEDLGNERGRRGLDSSSLPSAVVR